MFERIKEGLADVKCRAAAIGGGAVMAALPVFDATSDAITSWMPVIVTFAMLGIMIKFMNKSTQGV